MLTRVELAKKHNTYEKVFERLTSAAIKVGQSAIVVDDKKYRFEQSGGRWFYEEVAPIAVAPPKSDKEFLKQNTDKRKEAETRLRLVREYENRGELSFAKWRASLPSKYEKYTKNQRQFLRWVQAVRDCPENESPLVYLVDKRGINAKAKAIDERMAKAIEKMILEKPHRKTKRIYEYLKKEFGAKTPVYETVRKWVSEWKQKEFLIYAFAKNPDKAKGTYKPAGGSMSQGVSFSNEIWELDATPADVICSDGKRYTLSAAIDVYSRRVVVVVEESASYSTLAKVMRKGIKILGVPQTVKIDNGKDYTSNYFTATCQRLRINQTLCPPYSGEYKPHIERFFRTISHELFEELDGYIGHDVAGRQEQQNQKMFSAKLESIKEWRARYKDGDEFAKRFGIKKENAGLDVGIPLSRDELQLWIDKWILMYENRRHGGIKTKPIEKWNQDSMPVRKIEDERMLDILLGFSTQRSIRKKGIEWMGVTYWSEMFADMVGQKVWVLSDDDLSIIYIYDLQMNYLFDAYNPEYHNISRASFLSANKKWNAKLSRVIRELEELRSEAPQRMKEHIAAELNEEIKEEPIVKDIEIAQTEAIKQSDRVEVEADVMIQGRPTFTKRYDRFLWDMEHDMVDETTEALAEKYPEVWDMAKNEYERRKIS